MVTLKALRSSFLIVQSQTMTWTQSNITTGIEEENTIFHPVWQHVKLLWFPGLLSAVGTTHLGMKCFIFSWNWNSSNFRGVYFGRNSVYHVASLSECTCRNKNNTNFKTTWVEFSVLILANKLLCREPSASNADCSIQHKKQSINILQRYVICVFIFSFLNSIDTFLECFNYCGYLLGLQYNSASQPRFSIFLGKAWSVID